MNRLFRIQPRGGIPRAGLLALIRDGQDSIGESISTAGWTFDYVIDDANGLDTNAGTSEAAAWQSLNKLNTVVFATGTTRRILVKAGTYDKASDYINIDPGTAEATIVLYFEPGSVMNGASAGINNAMLFDGSAYTINIYGNGLHIKDYVNATHATSPAGLSLTGAGRVNLYDTVITGCDDGLTAHQTSQLYTYRCVVVGGYKAAIIHVGTPYHYASQCMFIENPAGGVLGIGGLDDNGPTGLFEDCAFVPANNFGQISINKGIFRRCRFGTLTKSVKLYTEINAPVEVQGQLIDCYVNVYQEGSVHASYLRCFGKLSFRSRPGGSISVTHSVVTGPCSGYTSFVWSNYNPGSSVNLTIHNNIFSGNWTFEALDAANEGYIFAAGSTFRNNLFHGGVAYSASFITAGGAAISGTVAEDPLLGAATGFRMADYPFGAGSPAIGAGIEGADIGFGLASVADLQHNTSQKADLVIVSGTGPADWVIKFQLSSKLMIAVGIDNAYYDASAVPQEVTWATHTDGTQVRLGSKSGVVYGWPQTTATIGKIDRAIGN